MFTFSGKGLAQAQLLARFKWKKVEVPRSWSPRKIGEVLVGFYAGRTTRNGSFGQYEVVLVLVPGDGAYMVSGVKLLQLIDATMIETGHPIQIIYAGDKKLSGDRTMKDFEVLIAEGDPIEASEMPSIGPLT